MILKIRKNIKEFYLLSNSKNDNFVKSMRKFQKEINKLKAITKPLPYD